MCSSSQPGEKKRVQRRFLLFFHLWLQLYFLILLLLPKPQAAQ